MFISWWNIAHLASEELSFPSRPTAAYHCKSPYTHVLTHSATCSNNWDDELESLSSPWRLENYRQVRFIVWNLLSDMAMESLNQTCAEVVLTLISLRSCEDFLFRWTQNSLTDIVQHSQDFRKFLSCTWSHRSMVYIKWNNTPFSCAVFFSFHFFNRFLIPDYFSQCCSFCLFPNKKHKKKSLST